MNKRVTSRSRAVVSKIAFFVDFLVIFDQFELFFMLSEQFRCSKTCSGAILRRFWSISELETFKNRLWNLEKSDFWNDWPLPTRESCLILTVNSYFVQHEDHLVYRREKMFLNFRLSMEQHPRNASGKIVFCRGHSTDKQTRKSNEKEESKDFPSCRFIPGQPCTTDPPNRVNIT